MHPAVRRAIGVTDESCLPHWTVFCDEGRHGVKSAIQGSERNLRVWNRVLRAAQPRAAAANLWLSMALGAAIAVECRPQTAPGIDPETESTSMKSTIAALKKAFSLSLKSGKTSPAPAAPARGPGSC